MNWILSNKYSFKTAKMLAEILGVRRTTNALRIHSSSDLRVIRYGNSDTHFGSSGCTMLELNHSWKINAASNKYQALKILSNAELPVPRFAVSFPENIRFPILGRKFHHTGGYDIVIIRTLQHLEWEWSHYHSDYYTQYIPDTVEYRYHVLGDKMVWCCKKIRDEAYTQEDNRDIVLRNRRFGYKFVTVQPRCSGIELAIKSVAALGLDFGAVDMLWRDGAWWILEVNTAPGLSIDGLVSKYVDYFNTFFKR